MKLYANIASMRKHDRQFIAYSMLTIALAYIATDIYLPALPTIKSYYLATINQTQHTLTFYLLGLAISQIATGPIIDRYGYRKFLVLTMAGFVVATTACALAPNIYSLQIARWIQGLTAGAAGVVSRASFIKRFSAEKTQHIFMTYGPAIILSTIISPVFGGFIVHYSSWRGVFIFVMIISLTIFLGICKSFHITEPTPNYDALNIKTIAKAYKEVLTHKEFMAYLILNAMYLSIIFSYVAESPFIFHINGYSSSKIGLSFIPMSLTFLVASQINKFLYKRISIGKIVIFVYLCILIGLATTLISAFQPTGLAPMIYGIAIASFGMGFSSPVAFSKALTLIPHRSGYASCVIMAIPFFMGTFLTIIVHPICGTSIIRLASFLAVVGTICVSVFYFLNKAVSSAKG